MNWEDAVLACKELTDTFSSFHISFNLLSIHSYEENEFVFNLPHETGYYNLGLKRNENETDFEWSDNSKFSYKFWYTDYPERKVKINFSDYLEDFIII